MKLIIIIMTTFLLQVSAITKGQNVTLKVKNTPLIAVLNEIRNQTGYDFFVSEKIVNNAKPVSLDLKNVNIEKALEICFKNQLLTYSIKNKIVTVKEKKDVIEAPISPTGNESNPIIIKGKVTDKNKQPLVGVNVRIKEDSKGTITDEKGSYSISVNGPGILIFSYIGYRSVEKRFTDNVEFNVILEEISSQLDQVQVIAYGTTTKRLSTGNVTTITSEVIAKQPVSNALLALEGRVPGMFIQQTTGVSAGGINVHIQGLNSLQNGTSPFYVVDGVPYSPETLGPGLFGGAIPGISGSALTFINPLDIESIVVLKDADATAIYGSRAANGAILITTKKGKAGVTKIDVNMQTGWGKVPKQLKFLDTKDYIDLRLEGKKNDNLPIYPTDYDINGAWDKNRNTNWQKELVGGSANFSNLQASLSGGTDNTQFLVGGGYLRETTVYPGEMRDSKGNVHFNINHSSANHRFKLNFSGTYLQDINKLSTTDLMSKAMRLPPNAPELYNSDGTLNWGLIPNTNIYSFSNPLNYLARQYNSTTNNVIGNAQVGYVILPGLELKTSLGYNRLQSDELNVNPRSAYDPGITYNPRITRSAAKSTASWIIEPQLNYMKSFDFGRIDVLVGSSFQQSQNNATVIRASGFTSDAQLENIQSAPNISITDFIKSKYRYNAIFGRINYSFKDKYILNFAGRRDGSSRYGSANQFANFYSIAGAWVFSEEDFLKEKFKSLSFGKIRVSYGTTGNDQIGDYQYLSLYNNVYATIPYQQTVGILPSGHANPYLQWELTRKLNFGLDLGLLDNKIIFTGNYYINRSYNQLLGYPLGLLTGFAFVNRNIDATIQNRGLELQLDVTPIKNKKLTWTSSVNFTAARNKLIRFDNLQESTLSYSFVIGQPVNLVKVFPFLGVNPETGLYEYMTADGKKTSSPNSATDLTKVIDVNPKWYGGFTNTFDYQNFTLSFLFQFVKQTGLSEKMTLTGPPGSMVNVPTVIADRWRKPGDIATYQKAGERNDSYNALGISDAAYSDASYIKLRNVSLSYSLPEKWLKKTGIGSARVFLQGQNLLTISNYFGTDPESQSIGSLPPLRVFTIGIHLNL